MPRGARAAAVLLLAASAGGCGDAPSPNDYGIAPHSAAPEYDVATGGPRDSHTAPSGDPVGGGGAAFGDSSAIPVVEFFQPGSSVRESDGEAALTVELTRPAPSTVRVDYAVEQSQARNHARCSPQDFWLAAGTLTFAPGETRKTVPVSIMNGSFFEGDERIVLRLSNPRGAQLGTSRHTLTITDDDRPRLVSVKDYGAKGDGRTDDTEAIQDAVNSIYGAGGGVLYFPPGTYAVKQVTIEPNVTYFGYGATLFRPAHQGKWTRTFTTRKNDDTRPLVVQGLTFNGNSQQQGPYRSHQLEQGHLLFLIGDPRSPRRLQVYVEDVRFEAGVGDGVSVYTNVDARICHTEAKDVFRGGFVLTGGYSSAYVYDLVTEGPRDRTGIDVEVDASGYGGRKTEITLERVRLDGDFDVGVSRGSVVTIKDLISKSPPFYIYAEGSTVSVSDSEFWVGYNDSYVNRLVRPRNVTFDHVNFYLTKDKEGDNDQYVLQIYPFGEENLMVRANNSSFHVADTSANANRKYVADPPGRGNQIIIDGGWIDPRFDAVFAPGCGNCVYNDDSGDGTKPGRREVTYPEDASGNAAAGKGG